ncbi:GNAT family N-acetyltransferase [Halodesulfurarchaeum sp.]|uniref:GNAT family N-acetyltransferase n=1 Tax=Halodesulfurarchaeum sp. TaxID=1980530 RepID=UPI001BC0EB3D|nr:GNAT family N-acetyltransferase [Halodesulfurarchaeum sp.]
MRIRPARKTDAADIATFTQDTWDRYEDGDYISKIFPKWAAQSGPDQETFVAESDGTPIGLVRSVLLSDHEAWFQGLRVDPAHRNKGVGETLIHAAFDWAKSAGATVGRAMVFSWNVMGLGLTRAAGFEPGVEFRWAHPEPDSTGVETTAGTAPRRAWSFWQQSGEREAVGGLGLDSEVPWALSELTVSDFEATAQTETVLTVERDRVVAMAPRTRVSDRGPGEETTWAEYGVAAWADLAAAGDLMAAIAADAASVGADKTRVLVPETARAVTDVAAHRVELAEEPDFVVRVDLTRSNWDAAD